ncbi:MAG: UPF0149 family protein [Gammaproteobacteria bacterium]|nr:UPF0149 family protein [Gammaproteobacteria bacterium]
MVIPDGLMKLPDYHDFSNAISMLNLPISCSELHGVLCGYLVAGGSQKGESYLRALLVKHDKDETRQAATALFDIFAISQHQLSSLGFDFELLLPEDVALATRAQAFSEWCEGFTQGLTIAGLDLEAMQSDDTQDAIHHLKEFAQLDYESLRVSEEDERALMEVVEYTRMAILSIQADIHPNPDQSDGKPH